MEKIDPLHLVVLRNQFYRRQYLLAMGVFGLSLLVIAALIWMLVYVVQHPTKPLFFATDRYGRLIRAMPLTQANMSDDEVRKWVIEAVESSYSYDYVNYRSQIQNTQKYFTQYGWTRFMEALTSSNNLEALTARKLVVIARVVEDPLIVTKGILSGGFAWKFEMPVLVTYLMPPYDQKSRFANALKISVIVRREPELQSYQGLGILQIIGTAAQG